MAIDFDAMWEKLEAMVHQPGGVNERIRPVFEFGRDNHADACWSELLAIDYSADVALARSWLSAIAEKNAPAASVKGLFFGIEEIWSNKFEGEGVFLIGADKFDPNDAEWASFKTYVPQPRNVALPGVQKAKEISDKIKDAALSNNVEYMGILGGTTLIVQEALRTFEQRAVFHDKEAVVAFIGGDFLKLGNIRDVVAAT